jgi:hypothetical protein
MQTDVQLMYLLSEHDNTVVNVLTSTLIFTDALWLVASCCLCLCVCDPNKMSSLLTYSLFLSSLGCFYNSYSHQEVCGSEDRSRYRDSLQAGRSGDRIPLGARFSAPVQTSLVNHPTPIHRVLGLSWR